MTTQKPPNTIREWFIRCIESRRFRNQVQAAAYLKISRPYLNLLIHQRTTRRRPGTVLAKKLSRKTGIPLERLLFPFRVKKLR